MTENTQEIQEEISVNEQSHDTQEAQDGAPQEPVTRDVDRNWERTHEVLRLQKQMIENLQREREELLAQKKQAVQEEPDEFADLDPEDVITVNKAKKLAESIAAKKAREEAERMFQQYAQQQNLASDEQRMRQSYSDYDYVIENFAIPLIKSDPALAYKIEKSKNPAETAYKLGKLSDSYEEYSMKQPTSSKAEKVLKNTSRPMSSAAASPLKSQADQFSKMSSNEIWQMSQKYARGA